MATRRRIGGRCGTAANVLFAFVLPFAAVVGLIAGCRTGDSGPGTGGPTGGTEGGGGLTISCNPSGSGCLCLVGDSQPGQITTCSPTSVVQNNMEQGVCCLAQALCACTRYTCRSDPATAYCQCGSVADLATVNLGTAVAECPAPTTDQKCCFSPDNASCICSRLACSAEETTVPSCSGAMAGACRSGEAIPACR